MGFELGDEGVGKGMRSRPISSGSCLNNVGVNVGEFESSTTLDLGVVPREPRISAESCSTWRVSRLFSASICASRCSRNAFCCSNRFFSFSSRSTSMRLRSRDVWAAARLRRTRSIRRCSFSSSVLARFLRSLAMI